jgi:acetoin utilization deacetylase AcuC-like enzyme
MSQTSVALLYDPLMLEHEPPTGHPERPERLQSVVDHLMQTDLWERCAHPAVQAASEDDLARIHSVGHIDRVRTVSLTGGGLLDHGDTVASALSWDAATVAVGAAMGAVDAAMAGTGTVGFALVRPPGHHATPSSPMGFCLFNNVAIAAAYARAEHGIERAMIVDFDVHHGNGTEAAFYEDPSVLFVSIHQYPAYPGTGRVDMVGEGAGTGATLNIPIPRGVGDDGYLQLFHDLVEPAADRFQPQLLLVSAGYDAHWKNSAYVAGIDERMTADGFHAIASHLQDIANKHGGGRIAAVLEGGYDLGGLSYGVENTIRAWLGDARALDPAGMSPLGADDHKVDPVIRQVKRIHNL